MKIIRAGYEIEPVDVEPILRRIELAGRTAYKSEELATETSAPAFIKKIVKMGHLSVVEHGSVTVRMICDRGVTHELVRHRVASYTQESTRYCNYSKEKFGNEITVIEPLFWREDKEGTTKLRELWIKSMEEAEKSYFELLESGASPQEARSVLPNSLKTEIVVTMNLREWRHFFQLRAVRVAHPQMREIAIPLLKDFQKMFPAIFSDLEAASIE
jgi:thymidylate synthase (FAD)